MKNKNCFIMIGVSGCGKSTVRDRLLKTLVEPDGSSTNVRTFSLDECRLQFTRQNHLGLHVDDLDPTALYEAAFDYANANSKAFDAYVNEAWVYSLAGDSVIVDNTNLTRKSRARWSQEARAKGFTVWAVEVMTALSVVLERQRTRGDKNVPAHIVRDMYMRQQSVLVPAEADVLVVVDGTKADSLQGVFNFAH
jgi:predicted kinase